MIKVEYKLVKWLKNGSYRKLPITIQQDAVGDFCELIGWNEEEFANNTIRYPIEVKESEEFSTFEANSTNSTIGVIPEEKEIPESRITEVTKSERTVTKKPKSITSVSKNKNPLIGRTREYTSEILDFLRKEYENHSIRELVKLLKSEFDMETNYEKLKGVLGYWKITKNPRAKPPLKFPPEMEEFVRENVETMSNPELAAGCVNRFGIEVNHRNIKDYMRYRKIKRSRRIVSKPKTPEIQAKSNKRKSQEDYVMRGLDPKIAKFIKNHPEFETDHRLRQALAEEFGIFYSIDQIEEFRRKLHPKVSAWLDRDKPRTREEEEND